LLKKTRYGLDATRQYLLCESYALRIAVKRDTRGGTHAGVA
jgi:hypothetical protein